MLGAHRFPYAAEAEAIPRHSPFPSFKQVLARAALAEQCDPGPPCRSSAAIFGLHSSHPWRPLHPAIHMGNTWIAHRVNESTGRSHLRTEGPLPSQALSTHSSPLSKGLSKNPHTVPSPILLLQRPFING